MTISPVLFRRVTLRGFRNLVPTEFEPAERVNVISGNNGQGKTSLLEALYFLATSRSFRTERIREVIQEGQELGTVRAELSEGPDTRSQRVVVGGAMRSLLIDDKRVQRVANYVTRTPVVAFHPGDLELVAGPDTSRRLLLDRLGLYLDPVSTHHRLRYQKSLRERQKTLEDRGTSASELGAYEQIMAEHGAYLARVRALAAERLSSALERAFVEMAAPDLRLEIIYRPGGVGDRDEFAKALAAHRSIDLRRGAARFGPQRDEFELKIDGRSARHHASQGQQRILTLALKAAELACVREARQAHPVLLLDDVSSELDPSRTGAVYEFLKHTQSQIFVTTTRPELFTTPNLEDAARRDFTLTQGQLTEAQLA